MPEAERIASRMTSASSRRGGNRQSRRLLASTASASHPGRLECRKVADITICFWTALTLQPRAMNLPASQSSRGWLTGRAVDPEIARCGRDPFAEIVLPEPVDHHLRCGRVARVGDPGRQGNPAALFRSVGGHLQGGWSREGDPGGDQPPRLHHAITSSQRLAQRSP